MTMAEDKVKLTFGRSFNQPSGTWTDQRELPRGELAAILTAHTEGAKDGACIVPATLREPSRCKEFADEICLRVLDIDCGHTLEEIQTALTKRGYAAVIYSTHSHLTTQTTIGRSEWDKFGGTPQQYLVQKKHYLPRVATGARVIHVDDAEVTIEHQPCPKYRVVTWLDKPWRAADYESQDAANQAWVDSYKAFTRHLGLTGDGSGSDPNRLFFLPRHKPGAQFETSVIEGNDVPLWVTPPLPKEAPPKADAPPKRDLHQGDQTDVIGLFNAGYPIETILERNGYIRTGRKYLSPTSSSKMPGISLKDGRCFSHHESDPLYTGDERHAHDAFGAFRILEHGGDIRKAVKAAAEVLGVQGRNGDGAQKGMAVNAQAGPENPQAGVPAPPTPDPVCPQFFPLTDLGNAERFAAHHGDHIRFSHILNTWFVWNGQCWERDETGSVFRLAKDTVRRIYAESGSITDEDLRKATAKHARVSEGKEKIKSMIFLASSEPGIPIKPSDLDMNPWLLNFLNGTVDLRTGQLHPHRQADLITKIIPVNYDPSAQCPRWMEFLSRVMDRRQEVIEYVKKVIGYTLTGDTREKAVFILHGTGDNGKTVFTSNIGQMLGDYAQETPVETLMIKRNETIPNDIARLRGARLVTASEGESGQRLAESLIKRLTGGDKITARFMHAEWFEFIPEFKIFLSTNHKPQIRGTDHAIWSRIHLIPFTVTIPKEEQIPRTTMLEQLKAEWPGIMAWAVEGCLEWQRDGIQKPAEVEQATQSYRAEMDIVAGFLADCCIINPLATAVIAELYKRYEKWCSDNGEQPLSQRKLGEKLDERGLERKQGNRGVWVRKGIGLLDTDQMCCVTPNDGVLGQVVNFAGKSAEKKPDVAQCCVKSPIIESEKTSRKTTLEFTQHTQHTQHACSTCVFFTPSSINHDGPGVCNGSPYDEELSKLKTDGKQCSNHQPRTQSSCEVK